MTNEQALRMRALEEAVKIASAMAPNHPIDVGTVVGFADGFHSFLKTGATPPEAPPKPPVTPSFG